MMTDTRFLSSEVPPEAGLQLRGPVVAVRVHALNGDLVAEGDGLIDTGSRFSFVCSSVGLPLNINDATGKPATLTGRCFFDDEHDMQQACGVIRVGEREQHYPFVADFRRSGFVAVIGRDFLAGGRLVYDGVTGAVELT